MKNWKIRLLSAFAAASVALCACQSKEEKEFLANKEAAESKSGIVYHTTYFVTNAESDKESGIPYPVKDGDKYYIAALNADGDEVQLTPAYFAEARTGYEVEEGVFLVPATEDGKKWGYVIADVNHPDMENVFWNTERIYDNAEIYTENLAAVSLDGKYGVINVNGEFVVQPEYDAIKYCCFSVMPALKDGEWYFSDYTGERFFGPFEEAESFAYGYAAVKKNGKWGYINKSGQDAIDFKYDEAYSVEDDVESGKLYAWTRTGDKWSRIEIK